MGGLQFKSVLRQLINLIANFLKIFPVVANADNGTAEVFQRFSDNRARQRTEIPGWFVKQEDVGLPQDHIQEQYFRLLTGA